MITFVRSRPVIEPYVLNRNIHLTLTLKSICMIRLKGDDEVLINNRHRTFPATYGSLAIIDLFFIIYFQFVHAQTFLGQRQVNISWLSSGFGFAK